MNIKKIVNWKLYLILLAASLFSIVAILPYVLTLQAETLKAIPMPLPIVILVSVIQGTVLIAILLFFGLILSNKLGLKIPILEGYLAKNMVGVDIKQVIKTSASLGILTGGAIIFLDFIFTKLGVNLTGQTSVSAWKGFLASFYGGISEEIIMRLFFMTFILWIISKLIRSGGKIVENNSTMWSAILVAALLFGIGHLPVTATLTTLTPLVICRALLLNGIGGVVFGWLYWKKGLEAAMIAHFFADIVIHGFFPLI